MGKFGRINRAAKRDQKKETNVAEDVYAKFMEFNQQLGKEHGMMISTGLSVLSDRIITGFTVAKVKEDDKVSEDRKTLAQE